MRQRAEIGRARRRRWLTEFLSRATSVADRIDRVKRDLLALPFEQHGSVTKQAVEECHLLSCEKSKRHFVCHPGNVERAIVSNTPSQLELQRLVDLLLAQRSKRCPVRVVDMLWGLSQQPRVWRHEVVFAQPNPELLFDFEKRLGLSDVVEHLTSHRAPESLHLASRLWIVRASVHQGSAESSAEERQ
jgi:hypothetical protein